MLGLSGQSLDRAARIPQLGEFDQKRMTEWKFMEFHGIPVFLLSCVSCACLQLGWTAYILRIFAGQKQAARHQHHRSTAASMAAVCSETTQMVQC